MKYLTLIMLLAAGSAHAAKEDRKACTADADCAVAEDPCGKARPLNKKYIKANEKAMGSMQTLMACPDGSASEAALYRALCKEKKCVIEKKEAEAPAGNTPEL